MSSAPSSPGLIGRMASVLAGRLGGKDTPQNAEDRIRRLGLSQRQQELNRLWAVYRCMQYAHCKVDWNGREVTDELASEVISTQGFVPPGFMDMSGSSQKLPLKFRRPSAPHALVKLIVDRFTGLLFSEQQHPEISVSGDPQTEDWLRAVVDAARLWPAMIQARAYGGAMGTAVIGFQFLNGKPVIEVHDPRWVTPEFVEHGSTTLVNIEKRYMYQKDVRGPDGKWERKNFWYRRTIDAQSDVLYEPVEVGNGEEPQWTEQKRVDHAFGFCPVVWVQNLPVQDAEDGDPDSPMPVYESAAAADALYSQANRAILANCDPQLVVTTKAEMAEVRLSGDQALRVPDGDAKFLEVQNSGPKSALELAEQFRKNALEMAACVLEHPDVAGKTATEVERLYAAMLAKADVLREQYGQRGIIPLAEMLYRAAIILGRPKALPQQEAPGAAPGEPAVIEAGASPGQDTEMDGIVSQRATVVRGAVVLPPRYETDPQTGAQVAVERVPGEGGTIGLKWPGYFQPTLDDVTKAVTAAGGAKDSGLVDDETAITFVAPYFKVEDQAGLVRKVREASAQADADMMAMMASANQPQPGIGSPPGPLLPVAPTE